MASDDDLDLRATMRFEDVDVQDDDMESADDLLDGLDDNSSVREMTDPFRPSADAATRKHRVPGELIESSRRTVHKAQFDGWIEVVAIVDDDGQLRIPPELSNYLKKGERVKLRLKRIESDDERS